MKYVMLEVTRGQVTQLMPVIFPSDLVHADVAKAIAAIPDVGAVRPVGAGTFTLHGECTCTGESETLGLKARPDDAITIGTHDYFHGL